MEQPVSRSVSPHCLLYLSADRICRPVSGRSGGSVTTSKENRLERLVGSALDAYIRLGGPEKRRVSVPCRPTVEVLQIDLGSRLLMAALLACRDAGQLQLRLADSSRDWRARITDPQPSRVRVTPLARASAPGLCGRILETLEGTGEQGARGCSGA